MALRYGVILSFLFVVVLIGGCAKPPATVDGKAISREKIDLQLKARLQEHKLQSADVDEKKMREAILQELIGEQLALNEAAAKGIKLSDSEVDGEIDMLRKKMGEEQYQKALKEKGLTPESYRNRLREAMTIKRLSESLVKTEDVTDQELQDYYKNSPKPFLNPARVNMKIVEFQSEDAARTAAAEIIKNKADFDEYAKKLEAEKKASVTDYGWVSPDFFSPSLSSSIKMLKEGQQGGPYKGQSGYYIVRVKERKNESIASFDEVKEGIRNTLLQQKRNDAFMRLIADKRKTAKIVVNLK